MNYKICLSFNFDKAGPLFVISDFVKIDKRRNRSHRMEGAGLRGMADAVSDDEGGGGGVWRGGHVREAAG